MYYKLRYRNSVFNCPFYNHIMILKRSEVLCRFGLYITFFVGERVAVKIIKQRTSLTNELNALKLHHENVTKIKHVIEKTECDNEQNHGIIVMEYVGQNNLQALIEKNDLSVTLIKR